MFIGVFLRRFNAKLDYIIIVYICYNL